MSCLHQRPLQGSEGGRQSIPRAKKTVHLVGIPCCFGVQPNMSTQASRVHGPGWTGNEHCKLRVQESHPPAYPLFHFLTLSCWAPGLLEVHFPSCRWGNRGRG